MFMPLFSVTLWILLKESAVHFPLGGQNACFPMSLPSVTDFFLAKENVLDHLNCHFLMAS